MRAIARRYVKSKPDTIKYWPVKTGKLNHALKLHFGNCNQKRLANLITSNSWLVIFFIFLTISMS